MNIIICLFAGKIPVQWNRPETCSKYHSRKDIDHGFKSSHWHRGVKIRWGNSRTTSTRCSGGDGRKQRSRTSVGSSRIRRRSTGGRPRFGLRHHFELYTNHSIWIDGKMIMHCYVWCGKQRNINMCNILLWMLVVDENHFCDSPQLVTII